MGKLRAVMSPEAFKVFGGLCTQAGELSAARRVAFEVAAALAELDGVALPGPAAGGAGVVVDAVGDLDWQATATAAGWLSADDVGALLGEVEQARAAAAQAEALADESERLRAELAECLAQRNEARISAHNYCVARDEALNRAADRDAVFADCEAWRERAMRAERGNGPTPAPVAVAVAPVPVVVPVTAPVDPAPAPAADVPPVPCDASGRPVVAPDMWARMAPALRASIVAREAARGAK